MKRSGSPLGTVLFFAVFLIFVPLGIYVTGKAVWFQGVEAWSFSEPEDNAIGLLEEPSFLDDDPACEADTLETEREALDGGAYAYYLPYYLSNSDYWTGVGLKNGSTSSSASVTTTAYGSTGTVIVTESKTIPPKGQTAFMVGSGTNREGWAKVTSNQPLTGLAFVAQKAGDALMFDMTLIPETAKTLHVPHVAQDPTWDTIVYVCNPNGSETTVYLTFFRSDGTAVKTSQGHRIPGNGSGLYPLSDLLGKAEYTSGSIEITASQGVAAFALYHNTKTSCDPNVLVTRDYWILKKGYQAAYDSGETVMVTEAAFQPLGQGAVFQTAFSGSGTQLRKYDDLGNLIHYGYRRNAGDYYIVDPPVSLLPSSLELNKEYVRAFTRSEHDSVGRKLGDFQDTYRMTVTGPETVTSLVPGYASFQAYKLHLVDDYMATSGYYSQETYDYWLARKIGIVKMTRSGKTATMTSSTEPYVPLDPRDCHKSLSYAGISAVIPEAAGQGSYSYYLPYVLADKNYWTGVGLRNAGETSNASITVTGIRQNGAAFDSQAKTIPPKGQTAFMMKPGEGWAKVTSSQPLTGLAFIAMKGNELLMFDIPFVSEPAKTLYVPHVAQDPTWDTIVYVCNPNGSETTMYLTFVKSDGTVVTSKKYTLPVNGSGKYRLSDVVGAGPYSSGSIEITSSQGVAAFALYHNTKTGERSYAGISAIEPTVPVSCTYILNPTSKSFTYSASTGSVSVTASSSSCAWTASSNASWLHITSGSSGKGNGTVYYSVDSNSGTSTRMGTLTIAGKTFTVSQGGKSCAYSISPTSQSCDYGIHTAATVSVTASTSSCAWTASSNASWLHVTSGSSGKGNGTVYYSVDSNSGTSTRMGTLTIAGKTVTVSQSKKPDTYTNSIGMTFVPIPSGTFMMGSPTSESPRDSDETLHQVTLTKSFYLQTTEVTQGQWKAVMGSNPSFFSDCGNNCPVENVDWYDCKSFISKLNQKEGTTKYRLPTEAEWEYACRAGTTTVYSWGNSISCSNAMYGNDPYGVFGESADECLNYVYNIGLRNYSTAPVMSYPHNAWGLHNMHGNVSEWCEDWYGSYPSSSVTDPAGAEGGTAKVFRGGSWHDYAWDCRSAYRGHSAFWLKNYDRGFRLVRDF